MIELPRVSSLIGKSDEVRLSAPQAAEWQPNNTIQ
jgi:hypothetical protein